MAVYLVLLFCALGIAAMVYRYDMYDREPVLLLMVAVVFGVICFWLAGSVEDYLLENYLTSSVSMRAAVAGVVEELGKVLLVFLVAVSCRPFFNDPVDGLIYGAFIGLGFGIGESFYFVSLEGPAWHVVPTEAVRLFLHAMMGGLGGYGIGLRVLPGRQRSWPAWLLGGVSVAMGTHFLWNCYVGLVPPGDSGSGTQVVAVLLMLLLTGTFGWLVVVGSAHSRTLFAPDDRRSVWGWPFRRKPADPG
ncbi:MAG: PrsW family glutamic-type intramembrane protease [Planctomycetota bacterium]|nr:PrsW family glutamic-type intramembrane protease [Planctomycetota bacterium]